MDGLQESIALNNVSAALFQAEENSSGSSTSSCVIALAYFQRAVHGMREFSERVLKDPAWATATGPAMGTCNATEPGTFALKAPHRRIDQLLLDSQSFDHYYLYRRPLSLPSVSNLTQLAAIVFTASMSMTFNIALARHQLGGDTGHNMDRTKACELYDIIATILDSLPGSAADTRRDTINHGLDKTSMSVLQCLSFNNRAQIYFDTCDYVNVNSERCVKRICFLLSQTHLIEDILSEAEMDQLRLNMVYLQPPSAAHAA